MSRWMQAALLALVVSLTAACATAPAQRDLSKFTEAKPASILVLPPVNESPDVLATPAVLSQLTLPLAESGYYVLPVTLVAETLTSNGVQTPADAHGIEPARLREIFGADAILYTVVKQYGSSYRIVSSDAVVAISGRLVDARSGEELWQGTASASSAEQGSSNQGGLVGMLVRALVEQVVGTVTDRSYPIAGIASSRLLSAGSPIGVIPGPRSRPAAAPAR